MEALLDHGEGLLVPERMIVAPSVGVFRPVDDLDEGDHVDAGQTVGHARRSRHLDPGRAARSAASSSACSCTPANGSARASRRLAARRLSDAGVRSRAGAPRSPSSASPTPTSSAASTPPTSGSSSAPASANAASRSTGETTASLAIEAGAAAIKHAGHHARRHRPPHRRHRDTRAADPPHRRVRRRRPRAPLRLVRPQRRVRRVRLRARRRRRRCSPAGNLDHVLVIGAETLVARRRPARPRHVHPLRRRRGRRRARAASPDDGPGLLAWDLGCDGSATGLLEIPAGGSRLPATPETVADRRALPQDAGPGGVPARGAHRRRVGDAPRSSAPASPSTTSTGSSRTRPTSASSKRPASRLGIPTERTLVNIDRYGNTSAASIPLVLAEAADDGRLARRRPRAALGLRRRHDLGQRASCAGAARDDRHARTAFVTGASRGIGRAHRGRARPTRAIGSRSATRPTTTAPRRRAAAVEAAGGEALAVAGRRRRRRQPSTPRSARSRTRSARSSCS